MAVLPGWRKALGALKDTTTVGLATLNSDFKELEIAIIKATNHVESPPKERYVNKIMLATAITRPRADVAYCIHILARRLVKTRNWTVALKTLLVIHRTLREGDPTFREELLHFSQKAHILHLSNFKDDSSAIAWDCSGWVRTYALFLEERLECFRILKYDVEAERLIRSADGSGKGHSRTRELDTEELLEQLPALQQVLFRLIGCRPDGAAKINNLVQYALALVLKESFKIYCAINDGIINLVDKFFEMTRHEALIALDIYRRAGQQALNLSEFYDECRGLELAQSFQFPDLKEPPRSFLATMEEYVKEAPRVVSFAREQLEYPQRLLLTYQQVTVSATSEEEELHEEELKPVPSTKETLSPPAADTIASRTDMLDTGDLLGLDEIKSDASAIEESNSLALAIVPAGITTDSVTAQDKGFDPTGWELALVDAPTGYNSSVVESKLGGGFDRLTLDSLYDEAAYRQRQQQQQTFGISPQNPFMSADPFAMPNQVPPPLAVQMAAMAQQQQQMFFTMQPNLFVHPFYQQPIIMGPGPNPFANNGFGAYSANNSQQSGAYSANNSQQSGAYSAINSQQSRAYSANNSQQSGAYSVNNSQNQSSNPFGSPPQLL